ncbi:MAG: outer membrane protein assembly factor BamC, partial [Pseudomonadales bacterium]|nr:outer membrane protein assembly factor BamC [Pseudomonadales bacterium]
PGIRAGRSEIYVEHRQQPLGAPYRSTQVEWESGSDNVELEDKILTSLAYYLGETINQRQSVSLLAGGIRETRTELIPDDREPVLKYLLPFNRAWATVGAALENARIDVEDLDRTAAIYYVYYDDSQANEPGFFGRLFSRDEKEIDPGQRNRYLVHVEPAAENEVYVTVQKDENTPADALVAERLLKIIKEYST